jgi:hypothetical protein
MKYELTQTGRRKVESYLEECEKKRNEILKSGIDTTTEFITEVWKVSDVEFDLQNLANAEKEGEFNEGYLITDDIYFDYPLILKEGLDYIQKNT